MIALDHSLFFIFYNLSYRFHFVDWLIVFFGEYLFYFALFIFAYFVYKNYKQEALQLKLYGLALFSALVARFGVATVIRFVYHRPRPFLAFSLPHLINDNEYSFPSGHTIFIFALATAVYPFNKKLAYFLYGPGFLIGLARIVGGVHYPSDIVGGIILGVATGIAFYPLIKKYSSQQKSYE